MDKKVKPNLSTNIMNLLNDKLMQKIMENLNTAAIKSASLVCRKWFNLISSSKVTMRKLVLQINEENIDSIDTAKLLRRYYSLEINALEFSKLAALKPHLLMLQFAENISLIRIQSSDIKKMLKVCKKLREIAIIIPEVTDLNWNNAMKKRVRLTTLEIEKCRLKLDIQCVNTWSVVKIFDQLSYRLKTVSLDVNAPLTFEELHKILDYIEQHHGPALTDLKLNHALGRDGLTKLVDYLVNLPNLKLQSFDTGDSFDSNYLRLARQQNFMPETCSHLQAFNIIVNNADDSKFLIEKLSKFKNLVDATITCKSTEPVVLDALKDLKFLESFTISSYNGCCELKLPKFDRPLKNLKSFDVFSMQMKDETVHEIFRSMPNLESLYLTMITKMTANGLTGTAASPYNIGNLKKLEHLSLDGLIMNKEILAKMKFPLLKTITFCIEGYKWELPIRDKEMHMLGRQCPKLQEVDESTENDTLWRRNPKTGKFVNEFLFSSSDEVEQSSDENNDSSD